MNLGIFIFISKKIHKFKKNLTKFGHINNQNLCDDIYFFKLLYKTFPELNLLLDFSL